jgi:hypothetical protein
VASRSQPLLSIVAPVARSSKSQGGSSYGHNLPWDIPVMLRVSPQTAGSAFGYIFLAINEHIHQDPLLAFFDNAGRAVHVLPCPDFEVFLRSNFISTRDVLFVTDLPPHMIPAGRCILEEDGYLMDAASNLSWLPEIPSALTFSRTSQGMSQGRTLPPVRMVPSRPPYPLVTYRTNPSRGMFRPNPDGINSHSFGWHPPIPYAMGGPPSYGAYSPLTTGFDVSVYVCSHDASQHGGFHHHRAPLHGTPAVGGQSIGGRSVTSLGAGFLLPTSLDSSETSLTSSTAKQSVPVPAPPTEDVPVKSEVPTIKNKPSDLGIKPIKDKESWLNAKKIIESRLCHPPYWSGPSGDLIMMDANIATSV